MSQDIYRQLEKAIEQLRPIKIRAYAILPATEEALNFITSTILNKYNRPDLQGPVYTAVKELAINGAKANIKHILFWELGLNMDDDQEYEKGMAVFKENLSESWVLEYALKARDKKLYVDIVFDYNPDRLIVEVINNRPISPKEDVRIRAKFAKSMKYDDIAQFFLEGGDSSEGAGMGIVLVTMLLKAQGIDPHLFTIRSNYRDSTIAKVEFPLHDKYIPERLRRASQPVV
ncbi:MAG: hypothetical protein NZM25_06960 [Leptospiraceae bacterium]|nr:hypothetical protein [Leptospiraceae bacterium]MDW8307059.1 hypothetical protein [Leptospiraceae bacterium]